MSSALIPLGLMAWIAFSLSFVLTNASYIPVSLSDPISLGWDLLGTANLPWQPILMAGLAPAQTMVLGGGAVWSARLAHGAATELRISPLPAVTYCVLMTFVLMWLLL